MGIPTVTIGLMPGFEVLGWAAPIILILCRMIQGLCTGGEYNGAALFALEHHHGLRQGLISGIISGSCVIGALSATLMGLWLQQSDMPSWAWRIAFVLGGVVAFIGYWVRGNMAETSEYVNLHAQQKTLTPLRDLITQKPRNLITAIIAGAYNGVLSYTLFGFLNIYMSRYMGFTFSAGIYANLFGLLAFMVTCPLFGSLSDRWGLDTGIKLSCCLTLGGGLLAFVALNSGHYFLIIAGQIVLGSVVGAFVGLSHVLLKSLFPTALRYTGSALGFSLGMALTGGTTAILLTATLDATQMLLFPVVYMALWAGVMYGVWFYVKTDTYV
jgi:MHS family proline/betaine transporter-like MFS transporter